MKLNYHCLFHRLQKLRRKTRHALQQKRTAAFSKKQFTISFELLIMDWLLKAVCASPIASWFLMVEDVDFVDCVSLRMSN